MAKKPTPLDKAALQSEYNLIVETLRKVNFEKKKAAELLGITRNTLNNKLKQYNNTFLAEPAQPV